MRGWYSWKIQKTFHVHPICVDLFVFLFWSYFGLQKKQVDQQVLPEDILRESSINMAAMIGQVAPDMELEIYKNGEAVCTTLLSLRTTGILVEKKIKKNVLFFCWCVCVCVFLVM